MKVQEIAYHRNGVSGEPFYVISFRDEGRNMLAVVFDYEDHLDLEYPAMPRTAVFDRDALGAGVIAFRENSWRGDHYDRRLRDAITEHERKHAAVIA